MADETEFHVGHHHPFLNVWTGAPGSKNQDQVCMASSPVWAERVRDALNAALPVVDSELRDQIAEQLSQHAYYSSESGECQCGTWAADKKWQLAFSDQWRLHISYSVKDFAVAPVLAARDAELKFAGATRQQYAEERDLLLWLHAEAVWHRDCTQRVTDAYVAQSEKQWDQAAAVVERTRAERDEFAADVERLTMNLERARVELDALKANAVVLPDGHWYKLYHAMEAAADNKSDEDLGDVHVQTNAVSALLNSWRVGQPDTEAAEADNEAIELTASLRERIPATPTEPRKRKDCFHPWPDCNCPWVVEDGTQ